MVLTTTETNIGSSVKCIPFKLSRVRFVTETDQQQRQTIVSGSWMEEVNRISIWHYDCSGLIENDLLRPESEQEDGISSGVLGDSADEPLLSHSLVHPGWVQDLKVHHPTQTIFSASSMGILQVFRTDPSRMRITRLLNDDWAPFSDMLRTTSNLAVSLSSLSLSTDGSHLFAGDDLGRLALISVDQITSCSLTSMKVDTKPNFHNGGIVDRGADLASLNALETVDQFIVVSVNQLGQLKVWDTRCGLAKPQHRLRRPGESQPLYCLAKHPGQPHLLAVGGCEGSSAAAYIWDLRAEEYPLTEVACAGQSVNEVGFHPRQPKHLYLATETAGLLRISCRGDTDSWTGFKGSRRKLIVSTTLSVNDVISFDLAATRLVCGHSDSTIQTVPCEVSVY